MTPEQVNHLSSLVEAFTSKVAVKYRNGVNEHGGNLWEMSPDDLLDNAIMETLDQFTYLYTLRQKMRGEI